jgi:adenylosuccinate lyase
MIERYCTPEMTAIWSRQAKYQRWMEVEVAVCEEYHADGLVSDAEIAEIRANAGFTLERCDELEKETRHDLMAFVRNLSETIGPSSRWIHFGLTSYDVIDSALGMMLRDSSQMVLEAVAELDGAIERLADENAKTAMIGRTHGIHAEPITFGFKLNGWRHELSRSFDRIEAAKDEVSVGKISGAVGIHAHVSPDLEARILARLGLKADPAATQIVSRDRLANLINQIALLGASLEKFATELRNLQRTEILEVQEAFASGQTGSSAMPHKRNPWNSETVAGLARILRGNAMAMLESVSTWHERDLTNSSVERIVLPDTFQLIHFMLRRLTRIVSELQVFPDRMMQNLKLMGDLVFSEHLMLKLIETGMQRHEAYKVVQRNAAKAWEGESFIEAVKADEDVRNRIQSEELQELVSLGHHLRNSSSSRPQQSLSERLHR